MSAASTLSGRHLGDPLGSRMVGGIRWARREIARGPRPSHWPKARRSSRRSELIGHSDPQSGPTNRRSNRPDKAACARVAQNGVHPAVSRSRLHARKFRSPVGRRPCNTLSRQIELMSSRRAYLCIYSTRSRSSGARILIVRFDYDNALCLVVYLSFSSDVRAAVLIVCSSHFAATYSRTWRASPGVYR